MRSAENENYIFRCEAPAVLSAARNAHPQSRFFTTCKKCQLKTRTVALQVIVSMRDDHVCDEGVMMLFGGCIFVEQHS